MEEFLGDNIIYNKDETNTAAKCSFFKSVFLDNHITDIISQFQLCHGYDQPGRQSERQISVTKN